MFKRLTAKKFLTGVPPWVLLGAVAVLLPIFAFMTYQNIHRETEFTRRLLAEKGAALIRAFEAGTRTGMGMHRGGFQLQRLITETSQQLPDVTHLIVTDLMGNVLADSDPERIGSAYGQQLDLAAVTRTRNLHWRMVTASDGARVFEVFSLFTPSGPPPRMMRGRMPPGLSPAPDPPQIIFVGLDMTAIEEARRSDVLHSILMGTILLLAGFAGIALLLLAQGYRSARTTLSRIKAFSDHVVENMPIGLVATDDHQRIAVFNQVAESVLRTPAPAVVGKPAEEALPPELWNQVKAGPGSPTSGAGAASETVVGKELDCTLAGGERIPLEIGAGTLSDGSGRSLGSILLFKDLTEIRQLRAEIALNQRLATVGRLAAGVAHEIRNPLSSIKGFATYFREHHRDNPQDAHTATIMIQEVDRLNRVVSQLLEFSRPVTILPRPIRLTAFIEDAVKLIEPRAREKGIALEKHMRLHTDRALLDPDRLQQVLLNLLLNAVEAMDLSGTLTVRAEQTPDGRKLGISVSDTGCGIRTEDMAHIFEPYFTTKAAGTGLGLAIARNIMDAMGGHIGVENRPAGGTTFTVSFPLVTPDAK